MKKGAGRGHWIAAARNRSLRACLLPVPSLVYARSQRPCRGGHRPPVSQGGGAVSRASTARPYHLCPNGRGTKELCNRSRRPCRGGHRPPVSRGGGAVSRASTARPYHLCPNGRGDKYRKPTPAIFSGGRLYPWVIRPVSRRSTCRTHFRRPGFCRRRGLLQNVKFCNSPRKNRLRAMNGGTHFASFRRETALFPSLFVYLCIVQQALLPHRRHGRGGGGARDGRGGQKKARYNAPSAWRITFKSSSRTVRMGNSSKYASSSKQTSRVPCSRRGSQIIPLIPLCTPYWAYRSFSTSNST